MVWRQLEGRYDATLPFLAGAVLSRTIRNLAGSMKALQDNVNGLYRQGIVLQSQEGALSKLPYLIADESHEMLRRTINGILDSITKSDWLSLYTFICDLKELNMLKIRPIQSYLVEMVGLLYNLSCGIKPSDSDVLVPGLKVREKIAQVLTEILRKNKGILRTSLSFDCLPLFELLDSILFSPNLMSASSIKKYEVPAFIRLALMARRWFDAKVVWDKINDRPRPKDHDSMARYISLLALFLPSKVSCIAEIRELLSPESFVWSFNYEKFEGLLMTVLARIAKNYGMMSLGGSMGFYYGIFLRHLKLPKPESGRKQDRLFYEHRFSLGTVCEHFPDPRRSFAKLIVFSLISHPETICQLRTFMAGLDSYFHPSNSDGWDGSVSIFHSSCCYYMARAFSSRIDRCGEVLQKEFPEIMWSAAEKLSLRDPLVEETRALSSIRYLTFINHEWILRNVIGGSAMALALSHCELHRTLSCIGTLASFLRLGFEEYRPTESETADFFALLPSCVMRIDSNDPAKTLVTLNLFASVFTCIPLTSISFGPTDEFYGGIVSRFLDRSFAYIESFTYGHGPEPSGIAGYLVPQAFEYVWFVMFAQMPSTLWQFAFEKVKSFLLDMRGAGGSDLVVLLAKACKGRFHNQAVNELLPTLLEFTKSTMESGMGHDAQNDDSSCGSLIWVLSCLVGLIQCSSTAALPFKDLIFELVPLMLQLRQERCVCLVAELLESCVQSWSDYYPLKLLNWTDDQYADRHGIAAQAERIADLRLLWHEPDPNSKYTSGELVRIISENLQTDEKLLRNLKVYLKFEEMFLKLTIISKPQSIIEDDCFTKLSSIASDPKVPLDIRHQSLGILRNILSYAGYTPSSVGHSHQVFGTWSRKFQSYPKQKSLPAIFQTTLTNLYHPRRAQNLLSSIYEYFLTDYHRLVFDDLLVRAKITNTEDALKGLVYTLRDYNTQLLIVADAKSVEHAIDCLFYLMTEHPNIPDFAELIITSIREIVMSICPKDYTLDLSIDELLGKYIDLYAEEKSGWQSQAIMVMLVYLLSETVREPLAWKKIISFNLDRIKSENPKLRSLAISLGSKLFHRYSTVIGEELDADVIKMVRSALEQFIPYLTQEHQSEREESLTLRMNCVEYFRSLAEICGPCIIEFVEQAFIKLPPNTTVPHTRATAEVYSGCLGGLVSRSQPTNAATIDRILTLFISRMNESGSKTVDIWYESGHVVSRDLGIDKIANLLRLVCEKFWRQDFGMKTAVNESIILRFISGLIRLLEDDILPSMIGERGISLLASPFELLRTSAIGLLLSSLSTMEQIRKSLHIEIPVDSPQAKALLILAESLASDPVRTNFWTYCPELVGHVARFVSSGDLLLQNEAKRVLRVLAWTSQLPNNASTSLISLCLTLITPSDCLIAISSRKALIEYLHLFYVRNLIDTYPQAESLLDQLWPVVCNTHIELRQESSRLFTTVFHSSPTLASKWKERIYSSLKDDSWNDLNVRHGLVLVSSSLILAFPYSLPDWIPSVLTQLTRYLGERHPIHDTVRKTISEFKRTHNDTWEKDRTKFTEDEVDAISELLVAPSHYA